MEATGCGNALVVDAKGRLLGRTDVAALRRMQNDQGLERAVQSCARVAATASVKRALPIVAAEAEPVAVVDEDGRLLGTIDRVGVINALARRSATSEAAP